LEEGDEFQLNSAPVTVGRGGQNDLVLEGDEFASARHARIEVRGDGAWVQDLDSTNGTYVNGARVAGAQRLDPGAAVRAGGIDALIQEANRRIYDRASTDPSASGMGTTMTVALVEGMTVAIGHVGDSRAYLVRGDQMEQLTEDHSLVNELMKTGKLSEEEAHVHPQRSVITRAVGTDPDVDLGGFPLGAGAGDR